MNNFTKSKGKAYWHAITNLTCHGIDFRDWKSSSIKSVMFFVLFMFSVTMSVQAQTDESVCLADAPEAPFTEEEYAALFDGQCQDGKITVTIVQTGDEGNSDCSWSIRYTYIAKCDEADLSVEVFDYSGGDTAAPEQTGELPPDQTGMKLCYDEIPSGPSEASIAALFTDDCGDVFVTKSGFPEGNDCQWSVTYLYEVYDACQNSTTVEISYSGGDTSPPELDKNAEIPTGESGLVLCYDDRPSGPSEAEIAALFEDNCGNVNVTKTPFFKGDDCGWKGEITYTIQDDCGNFADPIVIAYSGGDTEAPVLDVYPDDITVACADEIPVIESINFTDNCTNGKNKANGSDDTSGLGPACEGGVVVRTWVATDDCGNTTEHSINIYVDPAPPAQFDEPEPLTIDCKEVDNFVGYLGYSNGLQGQCAISGEVQGEAEPFDGSCGTFNVNYTYTDECGNTITATQVVTVEDTANPSIDLAASDLTVECDGAGNLADLDAWLANNAGALASDDCGKVTWSNDFTGLTEDCGATGYVTVVFTASDDCGNESKTAATFTIEDTIAPEITGASDLTVECDGTGNQTDLDTWLSNNGGATASDDICGNVTWSNDYSGLSDDCGATGSAEVTFTATDDCGNESKTTAVFTIEDTTAPEITDASDLTVECDGSGNQTDLQNWLATAGGASASDICGDVTWSNDFTGLSDDCGGTGSATVVFTASDACGLKAETSATFTIIDTASPPITNEAQDMTVECDGEGNVEAFQEWLNNNGGAEAYDICSDISWSNDYDGQFDYTCGMTGSVTVLFTVTDECGLSSSTAGVFTIVDTEAPVITPAVDAVVECDGAGNIDDLNAWLANNGGATGYDNCSDVTWTNNFTELSDDCGATGSATVEFTATDACGLSSKTTATFTIVPTDPYFTYVPEDITLECDQPDPMENATADDACGSVSVAYQDYYDYTPWEANVEGNGSVDLSMLPDGFVATGASGGAFSGDFYFNAGVTVVKSVDISFDWDFESTDFGGVFDPLAVFANGALDILYDQSGDFASGSYSATLDAGSVFAIGIANLGDAAFGSATVTVSNLSITLNELECPVTECFIRQFTATNECGLTATAEQIITFVDTTPPVIDPQAEDLTVECDGAGNQAELDAWLSSNGGASATDNCSNVTWTNDFEGLSDDCGATGSATVTFTATDECGNESTTTATFTIADTIAPEVTTPPSDLTVECDGNGNVAEFDAWVANNGGAVATDDCSEVNWYAEVMPFTEDCGATGNVKVEFAAIDRCGNVTKTTATFTIEDTTKPTIDVEASDETVECDGNGNQDELNAWLASNGGASASDICSGVVWSNDFTGLSDDCGATGSATVTFTATDDCGNSSSTTATFTIEDNLPPVITDAQDLTVECDGNGNVADLNGWLASNGGATGQDQCSDITWVNNFNGLSDDCGATGSAMVEFSAIDDCGNVTKTTATFTIVDTTKPSIDTDAQDLTVECDGAGNQADLDGWLASNGGAAASDICSGVTWSNDFTALSDDCGATGSATVTFTATDECGNESKTTATFTIEDTTPPDFTPASDLTVECDGAGNLNDFDAWLANNGGATATDVCSEVSWSNDYCGDDENVRTVDGSAEWLAFMNVFNLPEDGGDFQFGSGWGVPDAISLVDAENNTITLKPNRIGDPDPYWQTGGLFGNKIMDASTFIADNSLVGQSFSWNGFVASNTMSPEFEYYAFIRIFTGDFQLLEEINVPLIEGKGFSAKYNNTQPEAVNIQYGFNVRGRNVNFAPEFDAEFDALGSIVIEQARCSFTDECGATGEVTVTFMATDECGNVSCTAATFTIEDTTAPSIDVPPADLTVECDGQGNIQDLQNWLETFGGAQGSDQCGDAYWSASCSLNESANLMINGGFENGDSSGWTFIDTSNDGGGGCDTPWNVADNGAATNCQAGAFPNPLSDPIEGTYAAYTSFDGNGPQQFIMQQQIEVPEGVTAASISWMEAYTFDLTFGATVARTFSVEKFNVNDNSTTVVYSETFEPGAQTSQDWTQRSADVSACFVGKGGDILLVKFVADVPEIFTGPAQFGIDDVQLNVEGATCELTDECGETGSVTVEFTLTDECGNTSKASATFTIEDTVNPTIDVEAADETVECDGLGNQDQLNAWLASNGGASASDICSDVTWSNNFTGLSDDCGETGSATVIFTATDDCGNKSTTEATFTIQDTTKPSIDIDAQDQTVECDGAGNLADLEAWLASNGGAAASDICSGVTWSNDFTALSDDCAATGSATVTFTATDDCGNESKTTATFTIEDTTAPVLVGEVPPSINDIDACYSDMPIPPTEEEIAALFYEACGEVVVSLFSSPVGDDCGWSVIHIYSVEDECGNPYGDVKVFYSGGDETPPVLDGVPGDITVECDSVPEPAVVTAMDECSGPAEVHYNEDRVDGPCDDTYTLIRTWSATDECGNNTTETQTINVQDTQAPVLIGILPEGANQLNECLPKGDYGPSEAEIAALYEDNCGEVNVVKTINVNGDDCKWIMDISYMISDDCGNYAPEVKLWFHGEDMSAPEQVNCFNEIFLIYTGEDGTNVGDPIDGPVNNNSDCPADAGTSLMVGDIITAASAWTVAGTQASDFGDLAMCFTDNCTEAGDLRYEVMNIAGLDSTDCPKTIVITFDVLDECDNRFEGFTCTFLIIDDVDPAITCPPDIELDCLDADISPAVTGMATATDDCDTDVAISYVDSVETGVFEVDDFESGNGTWLTAGPAEVTGAVDGVGPIGGASQFYLNNGVGAVSDAQIESLLGLPAGAIDAAAGQDATEGAIMYKTITVEDGASLSWDVNFLTNEATPSNTFNDMAFVMLVEDGVIVYIDTNFGAFSPAGGTLYNQQTGTVSVFAGPLTGGTCYLAFGVMDVGDSDFDSAILIDNVNAPTCKTVVTRTWTATDDCGNTNSCEQIITLDDNEAPVLACPDVTNLGSDPQIDPATGLPGGLIDKVSYTDNCSDGGMATDFSDSLTQGPKEYVDRLLTSEADFSGSETLINFDDVDLGGGFINPTGTEYSAQGVVFSSPSPFFQIEALSFYPASVINSLPNVWTNSSDGQSPIQMDFSGPINRVGFYLATNGTDDVEFTATCYMAGSQVGQEVFITDEQTTFFGFESAAGFDQVVLTPIGTNNGFIIMDDLRFEGGGTQYTLERRFTATDDCGNTAECTAVYTWCVSEDLPPYNDCDVNDLIACGDIVQGNTEDYPVYANNGDCGIFAMNTAPGYWYTFIGTGEIVTVTTCSPNTLYDTKLAVYSDCGDVCVAGDDDEFSCPHSFLHSELSFESVLDQEYKIFVSGFGSSAGDYELTITCEPLPDPPANDLCENAEVIACGDSVSGSTANATGDGTLPFCGTGGTSAPGVWYVLPGTGDTLAVTADTFGSGFDTKLFVFAGACDQLVCIDGNDDFGSLQSQVSFLSEVGVDYYIYVTGFGSAAGDYTLTVDCVTIPANDLCENAEPIDCGQTVNGSTENATGDGGLPFCGTGGTSAPGVWYVLQGTGDPLAVTADTFGSGFDTKLFVFEGACDQLVCVDGNDDFGSLQSQVSFLSEVGVDYYIYVTGFGSAAGDYTLTVDCQQITGANNQEETIGDIELDFDAYPVPFDTELTVKYNFEFDTDVTIQVFDTKGLLIYSDTHNGYRKDNNVRTKIDLSRGGDQVFYVTVNTNRGSVTKKVVSSTLKRK